MGSSHLPALVSRGSRSTAEKNASMSGMSPNPDVERKSALPSARSARRSLGARESGHEATDGRLLVVEEVVDRHEAELRRGERLDLRAHERPRHRAGIVRLLARTRGDQERAAGCDE